LQLRINRADLFIKFVPVDASTILDTLIQKRIKLYGFLEKGLCSNISRYSFKISKMQCQTREEV